MNYTRGTAVKINSEVDPSSGTTVVLESLLNPSGDTVLSEQGMAFGTVNTSVAFIVWQSTISSATGRYTYKVRATNNGYSDTEEGFFFLR